MYIKFADVSVWKTSLLSTVNFRWDLVPSGIRKHPNFLVISGGHHDVILGLKVQPCNP